MVGADSVMVIPNMDYPRIVDSYFTGKTMASISTTSCDSSWKLVQDSCQVYVASDGTSVAKFSRWINPVVPQPESGRRLSSEDQAVPLVDGGDMVLTWAYGRSMRVAFHPLSTSGALAVNLATGEAFEYHRNKSIALYIHGIAMFLAFCVVTPVAIIGAIFRKAGKLQAGPSAVWFTRHWMIVSVLVMPSLLVGTVAAFLIPSTKHISSSHATLGLVVIIAFVVVVACSTKTCRPHAAELAVRIAVDATVTPQFLFFHRAVSTLWRTGHKLFGYGLVGASVGACITGFDAAEAYCNTRSAFIAYVVYVTLCAAAAVVAPFVALCSMRINRV
jgi:hypothetical protein